MRKKIMYLAIGNKDHEPTQDEIDSITEIVEKALIDSGHKEDTTLLALNSNLIKMTIIK